MTDCMFAAAVLLVLYAACLFILHRNGLLNKTRRVLVSALLLAAAFYLRWRVLDIETTDYQNFLTKWVQFFRENGGFRALKVSIGNYNFPYLYFLALFSYLPFRDLTLIKLLSVCFDVLFAWGAMKLLAALHVGENRRLGAFLLAMLLPTVILNGAYWGQCDILYTALAVWSLAFALSDKPIRALVMAALSFSFKLQAVFFLPIFLVLLFAGKVKLWHLPVFPLTFVFTALPAVLMGRPFRDALTLYLDQANSTGTAPNYNSTSIYTVLGDAAEELPWLCPLGIALAFGALAVLFFRCWQHRKALNNTTLLVCTALIVTVIPFFLPYMHERYFFLADCFTFLTAFALLGTAPAAILMSLASCAAYHAYLYGMFPFDMRYATLAVLLVLVLLTVTLEGRLHKKSKKR